MQNRAAAEPPHTLCIHTSTDTGSHCADDLPRRELLAENHSGQSITERDIRELILGPEDHRAVFVLGLPVITFQEEEISVMPMDVLEERRICGGWLNIRGSVKVFASLSA